MPQKGCFNEKIRVRKLKKSKSERIQQIFCRKIPLKNYQNITKFLACGFKVLIQIHLLVVALQIALHPPIAAI
jgi:hypothetical protein